MAIQMRRGSFDDFDKSKMLEGEWAVVLDSDPNAPDGKSVYVTFSAGNTKRLATYEDMVSYVISAIEAGDAEIIASLTEGVKEVNDSITAAEGGRVAAEGARVTAESAREEAETGRVAAETAREKACAEAVGAAESATAGAEKVNATLSGTVLTVTDRTGASATVDTKGDKGDTGEQGLPGAVVECGAGEVGFYIDDAGHLICVKSDDVSDTFALGADGHLYLTRDL